MLLHVVFITFKIQNVHIFYWELIYLIAGDVENALHYEYRNKRIKQEWFLLDEKDVEDIKKLPSGFDFYLNVDAILDMLMSILKNYRNGLKNLEKYTEGRGNVLKIDYWDLRDALLNDDMLHKFNNTAKGYTIKLDFLDKPKVHTRLYLESLIENYKKYLK